VTYWFAVGRLSCAVVSDGQMEPPLAPPLEAFFTPGTGVPDRDLRGALAAEGQGRTMVRCGYNCLLVETPDGRAVIDTGLGARFLGYGPRIEPLVGRLGGQLAEAGATELSAVLFTHLHQDHARGATWSGELTFPAATGFAHAAEVAFWSASGRSPQDDEHRPAALDAIRLFGEKLRPFESGEEVLPHVRAVDAAGHTPGHTAFGTIGPQPSPSPGPGRRREPPRPRVPHAVSRTGPGRAARQRLPVDPGRLEHGTGPM
jgi:metallo-beta-lactamase superfamily protein